MTGKRIEWLNSAKSIDSPEEGQKPSILQENKVNQFGNVVFHLFKHNNVKELLKYLMNKKEYIQIYYKKRKKNLSAGVRQYIDTELKQNREWITKRFVSIREEITKKGLDWTKAKLDYISYDIMTQKNMRVASLKLHISDGERTPKKTSISVHCFKLNRGWELSRLN